MGLLKKWLRKPEREITIHETLLVGICLAAAGGFLDAYTYTCLLYTSQVFQLFADLIAQRGGLNREHLQFHLVSIRQLPASADQPVAVLLTSDADQNGRMFWQCFFVVFHLAASFPNKK